MKNYKNTKKEQPIVSRGEKRVEDYLKYNKIPYETQKEFPGLIGKYKPLRFDFYLPKHNICIEYDGIQHFEVVEDFDGDDIDALKLRQEYDTKKNEFCYLNKINIVRIKYTQESKIEIILYALLFKEKNNVIESQKKKCSGKPSKKVKDQAKEFRKQIKGTDSIKELEKLKTQILNYRAPLQGNNKGTFTSLLSFILGKIKRLKSI